MEAFASDLPKGPQDSEAKWRDDAGIVVDHACAVWRIHLNGAVGTKAGVVTDDMVKTIERREAAPIAARKQRAVEQRLCGSPTRPPTASKQTVFCLLAK
jgi:hypothetical protein